MSSPEKNRYFEIRKSKIQGRGAFATRRIRSGTRIMEYAGELISQDEANRRYNDDEMRRHHTFLFALDDDRVIDGAVGGNDSRYVNHSCAPNCQAVNEDGHIFVEALRTIEPDEELLYDYAYARTPENDNPESEALYACKCGAPNCRGTILEPPKRKAARKAAAKKGGAKKAGTNKAGAKRTTTKRATAKLPAAKKGSAKKPVTTKRTARRSAAGPALASERGRVTKRASTKTARRPSAAKQR